MKKMMIVFVVFFAIVGSSFGTEPDPGWTTAQEIRELYIMNETVHIYLEHIHNQKYVLHIGRGGLNTIDAYKTLLAGILSAKASQTPVSFFVGTDPVPSAGQFNEYIPISAMRF